MLTKDQSFFFIQNSKTNRSSNSHFYELYQKQDPYKTEPQKNNTTQKHQNILCHNKKMASYSTSVLAHLFGIIALILMLVWLLHYQGGIEYDSDNPLRVFNVHPFLMFFGFIFLVGQAIMSYHTVPGTHETQKTIHMTLHFIAIVLGIVGICAVFKFHDMVNLVDVYSLHSWIGLGTFCLVGLQWLFGLTFMFQGTRQSRAAMAPWHIAGGRALFYMAICAALTGLMERTAMLKLLPHQRESHLINFTGLAILLFGVFVDMTVGLGHIAHIA